MSTPVAIAAGIGNAGKHGVLIKGGAHLETLGAVRAIALDKTGTLTKGKPVVTDIMSFNGDERKVLQMAYSIERLSEHPLAKAIVEKAAELKITPLEVSKFESLTGLGVKGNLQNDVLYVGKPKLFEKFEWKLEDQAKIKKLTSEGRTVICVGTDKGVEGLIAIRDEIRPQAKKVIDEFHKAEIKVVVLTGDNEVTANAIASELGIDEVKANLSPENKSEIIKELRKKYRTVAMVGDGINDAPALAQASVGIAMGTGGTDTAIEAADVALMADDLSKVPYAIRLGKKARRISRQNIVFSILLLTVMIPLALIGVMSVAFAVAVHEGSEILAVLNGLRMRRVE
jgi:Cd2+/Zn2+-exporting ATPase